MGTLLLYHPCAVAAVITKLILGPRPRVHVNSLATERKSNRISRNGNLGANFQIPPHWKQLKILQRRNLNRWSTSIINFNRRTTTQHARARNCRTRIYLDWFSCSWLYETGRVYGCNLARFNYKREATWIELKFVTYQLRSCLSASLLRGPYH